MFRPPEDGEIITSEQVGAVQNIARIEYRNVHLLVLYKIVTLLQCTEIIELNRSLRIVFPSLCCCCSKYCELVTARNMHNFKQTSASMLLLPRE
jgi:hypothetical protein